MKLNDLIQDSIRKSFEEAGVKKPAPAPKMVQESKVAPKRSLKEALVLLPKTFLLKTEFLSSKTKEAHEKLYKSYTDTVNKVSSLLDAVNPEEANSFDSPFRSLKIDEQYNLNASKLHDLYFTNISDVASQVAVDSLPYMRFARDFGTFDRWQFDFRACAMSAREGWVVTYFEPLKNVYMNCVVDGHNTGIPLGGVPILVMDMWAHSYYRDYLDDRKSYVNAMMREINWNVVEARMVVAERSNMDAIFRIQPVQNSVPDRILTAVSVDSAAPISKSQVQSSEVTDTAPGPQTGDQGTPRGTL
jgi:superoxide dismutase, Fe-Mn family